MKTKAQIVQELLDERKITAEDAVVLLTNTTEKEYIYVPQPYPVAAHDHLPWSPWTTGPIYISGPMSASGDVIANTVFNASVN